MSLAPVARKRILVVDDDAGIRESLTVAIEDRGWEAEAVASGEAALARLDSRSVDVVVLDDRMPRLSGREVLREMRTRGLDTAVLFLTAYADEALLRELVEARVDAFSDKPFRVEELLAKLERLLDDDRRGRRERAAPPADGPAADEVPGLVGRSAAMRTVYEQVRTFAAADLNVLVTGETGVGKEGVARAIHALSRRSRAPFVSLNCANLEPHLLESELFGYVAGAFTDAKHNKRGLFVEADGGVAFLDEVTDLTGTCQAKLLRAIQEKAVRPVGGTRQARIDVRFIAACNEDIRRAVRERRFREDLYHRLAVATIHVPPLRDRLDDLRYLVPHLLARIARGAGGGPPPAVTPRALRTLMAYEWPGNVRELENVLHLALVYAAGGPIDAEHVRLPGADETVGTGLRPLAEVVEAVERAHILRALRATQWVKGEAAERLGIARTTLNRKIAQYRLDREV
ncbi:MAG TPA: sigma-54 dependent transcriptional regulator [Thermodesulfobacteriota bacterium]